MTDQKAETRTADEAGGIEGQVETAANALRTARLLLERTNATYAATLADEDAVVPKEVREAARDAQRCLSDLLAFEEKVDDARRKRERGGGYDRDDALREVRRRMAVLVRHERGGGTA